MIRPSFIKSLEDSKMTIKDWVIEILFYNPLSIKLRKIGRFILRLIRWIPVLWKQEEWDFGYTYDILEHKIKEIRNNITKDTWHTSDCVKEELEQIDSVLDHLDKFRNWTKYIEIPSSVNKWVDNENGTKSLEFTEEEHLAYQKAEEFEEEHYNAFWDELKEYSSNWWT